MSIIGVLITAGTIGASDIYEIPLKKVAIYNALGFILFIAGMYKSGYLK